MARRRRGRGRKSKAIAVLPTIVGVMPAINAYRGAGLSKDLPAWLMVEYTGYNPVNKTFDSSKPIALGTGVVVAIIGHKLANNFGINRTVKKLTGGMLQL